jgi:hypothetical protein
VSAANDRTASRRTIGSVPAGIDNTTEWLKGAPARVRRSASCSALQSAVIEALVGRFSGVDRAADGEPGPGVISPRHGLFSRLK